MKPRFLGFQNLESRPYFFAGATKKCAISSNISSRNMKDNNSSDTTGSIKSTAGGQQAAIVFS